MPDWHFSGQQKHEKRSTHERATACFPDFYHLWTFLLSKFSCLVIETLSLSTITSWSLRCFGGPRQNFGAMAPSKSSLAPPQTRSKYRCADTLNIETATQLPRFKDSSYPLLYFAISTNHTSFLSLTDQCAANRGLWSVSLNKSLLPPVHESEIPHSSLEISTCTSQISNCTMHIYRNLTSSVLRYRYEQCIIEEAYSKTDAKKKGSWCYQLIDGGSKHVIAWAIKTNPL